MPSGVPAAGRVEDALGLERVARLRRHHDAEPGRGVYGTTRGGLQRARISPSRRSRCRMEVKCRWKTTNSATAGAASTTAPARIAPYGLAGAARHVGDVVGQRHRERLHGVVCLVIRNGQRNSFHGPMKVSSTAVSSAGRTSGRAIDHRMRSSPAPSIRAASNSSCGQLQEVLPEDEHRGRVDRERQDHPEVGVGQAVVADDQHVERDHQQLERHHLHQQHGREHRAAAAEVQHRQGVAGEHAEDDRARGSRRR